MDELGAATAGPAGEVILLHHGGGQPAAGCVQGAARTRRPTANNKHVELLAILQLLQIVFIRIGRQTLREPRAAPPWWEADWCDGC